MGCTSVVADVGNIPITPLTAFRNEALQIHNEKRKLHGSPDLIISEYLNNKAQQYAEKMLASQDKKGFQLNILNDSTLGENIILTSKSTAREICEKWYKERDCYDFSLNKYQKNTGHFTQLVWKETKEVGFGYEMDENKTVCCVALYFPAGNILGEFTNNVHNGQNGEK